MPALKPKLISRPVSEESSSDNITGISLPEEEVDARKSGIYNMLIYGHWGIGKSTLSSSFSDTFHLFTELNNPDLLVPGMAGYHRYLKDWPEFCGYIDLLIEKKKAGTLKYQYVVIDVISGIWKLCWDYVLGMLGVDYPRENYGQDWGKITEEFCTQLDRLMKTIKVIYVSHEDKAEYRQSDGTSIDKYGPVLGKGGKSAIDFIFEKCTLVGFYWTNPQGNREILIDTNPVAEAKNNFGARFRYSDGSRIKAIPMGNNPENSSKWFQAAYNCKLKKPTTKQKGGEAKK